MSTILLVEDDPNSLTGLQELLGLEGYAVHGVDTGAKAIRAMDERAMQIVLCDYRLPDFNGLHVCRTIKDAHPEIPCLLLTAYKNPELLQEAKEIGIEKIFNKPIVLEELLDMLNILSCSRERKPIYSSIVNTG